jgi:predicted amidohydrolase YtcJ
VNAPEAMLIRQACRAFDAALVDVRIRAGRIVEVAPGLPAAPDERLIEAHGSALLPGLHDHHLHLLSFAAALDSVRCGPPAVRNATELGMRLRQEAGTGAAGSWLRGIGYHESVAGDIDRDWLDRHVPERPLRIQHRSGRLWILNSRGLELLGSPGPGAPLEYHAGRFTGRLYDADAWLGQRIGRKRPSLAAASRLLASFGITGVSDATAANSLADYEFLRICQRRGELLQRVTVMGDETLERAAKSELLSPGARKIHLHEHELPEFAALCATIAHSHASGRPVAVHCVTLTELACTIAALATAGSASGDRIEHASVVSPDFLDRLRTAQLTVVTQPNFVAERGDHYLQSIPAREHGWLYRLQSLSAARVAVAAGSDAPFGDANPWRAMQAAVTRRTAAGHVLGPSEALSPERACGLFLGKPLEPARPVTCLAPGMAADLCLLDRDWTTARRSLSEVRVRLTLRAGTIIWDSHLDQNHMPTEVGRRTYSENSRQARAL